MFTIVKPFNISFDGVKIIKFNKGDKVELTIKQFDFIVKNIGNGAIKKAPVPRAKK